MYLNEDLEIKLPIHKILPFANVDGIGNRTSVFVQGCNIRCIYCHNPETQDARDKIRDISIENLIEEIDPYSPYVRGITVSGGEPTLYPEQLTLLFKELHRKNLTCYIDSNGYFDRSKIASLINQTDKFLFDVKTISKSKELLGIEKTGNIENLKFLLKKDKVEEVRHVVVSNISDSEEVVEEVSRILKPYPQVLLKLIKVHTRGSVNEKLLQNNIPSNKFLGALGKTAKQLGVEQVRIQL